MQQKMTTVPPPSEVLPMAPITASLTTATLPAHPISGTPIEGCHAVLPLTPLPIHLQRLQTIQMVCENQTGQPSFLSIADARIALVGLERYFAPLFERHQIALTEVNETLLWAGQRDACGEPLLVEDVIQSLVARIIEDRYLRRRLDHGRNS